MKNLFIFFFTICCLGTLSAEITVKSFRKLENDLTARIDAPKKDRNGQDCAIIKVVTTQTNFAWEGDALGIVAAVQKVGEYWLYVPWGTKRLTIKHPQLGVLRDYMYTSTIEQASVYELVLVTGKVTTIVEETIESQWLVITPEPENALIYINDEYVKSGEYMTKLKLGSYNYRVELPLYYSEAGRVEVGNKRKNLTVKLKPAFGYIRVNAEPENGAQVFLNGKLLLSTTPLTTDPIASGEHTVQVVRELYQPTVQKVNVTEGKTSEMNVVLQPNFAELTIKAPAATSIVVNKQQKGTGNWNGRLSAGVYSIEAQLAKHRTARQDIELSTGEKRSIELQPTPIYGSLDVVSSPSSATITIEGKDYGTTPTTINNLLIGDYTVQLNRQGYAFVSKNVSITEGTSALLNETLSNGQEVTVHSIPAGANLLIDGNVVGKTPYTGYLTIGGHLLKIKNEEESTEQWVEVSQSGEKTDFTLTFGFVSFLEEINNSRFEMIAIKGGTFQMGSNDGNSDEKPLRQVTISDFYVAKTEVTQEIWTAVMGNNPSYFKGVNLPVEQVSWNDCQEFLKKLNQLTGKAYRLPTEAEWEYACRAGTTSPFSTGGCLDASQANYDGNDPYSGCSKGEYRKVPLSVGSFSPNAWGLYDMHGNVWEWTNDYYGGYSATTEINPRGPKLGSRHVLRGGSWFDRAYYCRSACRLIQTPKSRSSSIGFRLVSSK